MFLFVFQCEGQFRSEFLVLARAMNMVLSGTRHLNKHLNCVLYKLDVHFVVTVEHVNFLQ